MVRKNWWILGFLVALGWSDLPVLGVTESKAQYVAVPVEGPGVYRVQVRGRGYRARYREVVPAVTTLPVVTSAPAVVAAPAVVTAPVVTETRFIPAAPATVIERRYIGAPVIDPGVVTTSAVVPTYQRRYLTPAPVFAPVPVVTPRAYVWPY